MLAAVMAAVLGCGSSDGSDDAGPPITDISESPECRDFCKRIETACPDTKCDPKRDCDVEGDCIAEKRRSLACQANPTSSELTCEHPGFSIVSTCIIPKNICGS
jgi:hypothetical protein